MVAPRHSVSKESTKAAAKREILRRPHKDDFHEQREHAQKHTGMLRHGTASTAPARDRRSATTIGVAPGALTKKEDTPLYPVPSGEMSRQRRDLAPEIDRTFQEFSRAVFKAGALDTKTKQLIAVAVAHVTQCPYCIRGHTRGARREGATAREIMEAIWVAAEMRAGGAFAHSLIALDMMARHDHGRQQEQ